MIPGARFVEVAGASHLGVFTHADDGGGDVVSFFAGTARRRAASERPERAVMGRAQPTPSCSPDAPSTGWASAPCNSPVPVCSDHRSTATGALAVLRRAVDGRGRSHRHGPVLRPRRGQRADP